jgi:hypothetical protein
MAISEIVMPSLTYSDGHDQAVGLKYLWTEIPLDWNTWETQLVMVHSLLP